MSGTKSDKFDWSEKALKAIDEDEAMVDAANTAVPKNGHYSVSTPNGTYIVPEDGTYQISTAPFPSNRFKIAPFPLDRLKLGADGNWSNLDSAWSINPEPETPRLETCNHNWVDVGFNHSKIICSKCDIEKPYEG